jgi:hypothetical protein
VSKLLLAFLLFWSLSATAGNAPDYRAERLKLASESSYDPYSLALTQKLLLEEHYRLANDPKTTVEEINAPIRKLLDIYPLGIQANLAVADFLEYIAKQADPTNPDPGLLEIAKKKREKANAILDSILGSGDGKTPATAFQVINTTEEYAVLDHFGLEVTTQALLTPPGKSYDLFTAKDKDGTLHSLYFDISLFFDSSKASD